MIRKTIISAFVGLGLLASGCAGEEAQETPAKGELVTPSVGGGKTDVTDRVSVEGRLDFDTEALGEFKEDLEFHGYVFEVAGNSTVTVEVTQKGSSRGLDTSLFLYGPQRGSSFGTSALVSDDDDGFGALSKIVKFRLEPGKYFAVVGTASGRDRGRYRLMLTCDDGQCLAPEPEVDLTACPDEVEDWLRECINETSFDLETSNETSWGICRDNLDVLDTYESLCFEDAFTNAPDFCAAGEDAFSEKLLPNCADMIEAEFNVSSDIRLTTVGITDDMDLQIDIGHDVCDGFCEITGAAYTYEAPTEEVSESMAVNAVIAARGFDAEGPWGNDGKIDTAEMNGDLRFREMLPFVDMAQALAGDDTFTVGQASFSDEPFAAVEAIHTGYVMLFPKTKFIVVLELTDFIE